MSWWLGADTQECCHWIILQIPEETFLVKLSKVLLWHVPFSPTHFIWGFISTGQERWEHASSCWTSRCFSTALNQGLVHVDCWCKLNSDLMQFSAKFSIYCTMCSKKTCWSFVHFSTSSDTKRQILTVLNHVCHLDGVCGIKRSKDFRLRGLLSDSLLLPFRAQRWKDKLSHSDIHLLFLIPFLSLSLLQARCLLTLLARA